MNSLQNQFDSSIHVERHFAVIIRHMLSVLALLVALTGIVVIGVAIQVGGKLIKPAHRMVGNAPPDLPAETVILQNASNQSVSSVSGWFVQGKPEMGVVLLLHGVRSDRRQMLGRAKFLSQAGYSVMLIDLPAHGESSGEHITFGYREAEGVKVAMRYLTGRFPCEKIAVIGVSLGAASFVLSRANPAPAAVVLEAMYPTIEEAIFRRLEKRLGSFSSLFTPLFLWQLPLRLGVSADHLRPITELLHLHCPVLILSGADDRHTTVSDTQRIFAAANQPKALWIVADAAHVNLHAHAPQEYEARVLAFLRQYLQDGG